MYALVATMPTAVTTGAAYLADLVFGLRIFTFVRIVVL
jgi:hypothetical protein